MNQMDLPSPKQLRHFVALERFGHFGKAADACFVSQPAFSASIRALEETLGVTLVDRSNRQVTITQLGREVAVQARLCLTDLESLVGMGRLHGQPLTGPLHIGVIPTIAPFFLPRALPRLRKDFPALKPFLFEGMTATLHQRLMEGRLDVALVALPYDLPNTRARILFEDPFLLAYRSHSKLLDPAAYRLNRLAPGSVLLLEEGHCLRDQVMEACRIRSTEKVSKFAATSLLTLVAMVDADLGITFLPELAQGSALLKSTRVKLHPLKSAGKRDIALIWRESSSRSEEFETLATHMAEIAG